jgi:hypothetical protein
MSLISQRFVRVVKQAKKIRDEEIEEISRQVEDMIECRDARLINKQSFSEAFPEFNGVINVVYKKLINYYEGSSLPNFLGLDGNLDDLQVIIRRCDRQVRAVLKDIKGNKT